VVAVKPVERHVNTGRSLVGRPGQLAVDMIMVHAMADGHGGSLLRSKHGRVGRFLCGPAQSLNPGPIRWERLIITVSQFSFSFTIQVNERNYENHFLGLSGVKAMILVFLRHKKKKLGRRETNNKRSPDATLLTNITVLLQRALHV
jgi:hypothetical protein